MSLPVLEQEGWYNCHKSEIILSGLDYPEDIEW